MSWLARLKSGNTPEEDASKTTETVFVVSEALSLGPLQKIEGPAAAANDPAPAPTTTVQPFIAETVNKLIDIGTVRPPGLSPLLLAASLALDASISAAETLPGNHFDSDYWPHSMAMNGISLGAAILGPIHVGKNARIGANAVVTKEVPEGATMVGIPARPTLVEVKKETQDFVPYGTPCSERFDPATQQLEILKCEMEQLQKRIEAMAGERTQPKKRSNG